MSVELLGVTFVFVSFNTTFLSLANPKQEQEIKSVTPFIKQISNLKGYLYFLDLLLSIYL